MVRYQELSLTEMEEWYREEWGGEEKRRGQITNIIDDVLTKSKQKVGNSSTESLKAERMEGARSREGKQNVVAVELERRKIQATSRDE